MIAKMKERIPLNWKINYKYYKSATKFVIPYGKKDLKIFVTIASDYGNLGDIAITQTQIAYLQTVYPSYNIISVYASETYSAMKEMKKKCSEKDIITIIGGGNMGDLYKSYEEYRRTIIKYFPKNKIISFPQTIDFSETESGRKALQKTQEIYSRHRNLHLLAREPISYEIMKRLFPYNKVYLVPDIVLSRKEAEPILSREHILVCLRNDMEINLEESFKRTLITLLEGEVEPLVYYDTHIGDGEITMSKGKEELEKIFHAFKKSKIVITDRLHGMIFCAITKTPCIVFQNSNHKIEGTYNQWLKGIEYIKLLDPTDMDTIRRAIKELKEIDLDKCDIYNFELEFQPLLDALNN
ncbi:putative polysaccharide pyruvyl transferase [Niallia circulans]|uniref:polysaccharide pyruvyl transferase family protein n=1 Tax=Niallia TaxID=2837506 RepID=UPI00077C17CB|nr:polysaccharide pyruvyl transferase family protein [Niallia circulans]MDR4317699.1 polysaccharide biosynthesis protein [Niallia circulans]MED3841167.1 polysaccharide pyruvyl transferase family protein [Niallia circulans]MED4245744.1 polysaccharide pyruvyl transferase family protein [Niallia circulans]MED4247674.1 polysaccharide pyruvyl transferase family protein [Niallia circulans]QKH63367.1 polysaccharide pyruvyl transferase family protein [Niallia circulans]